MKIAILGAGFTGLSASLELSTSGHEVVVFEKENLPGGLAAGFKDEKWDWPLEKHYHHIFTSDEFIKKHGPFSFYKPITATFTSSGIRQLDSPGSLLKFSDLSFLDRLRTGAVLGFLKLSPFWLSLEKVTAHNFLSVTMGKSSWETLWRPLFDGKFGKYANQISAAWFWARIKKRSSRLGYPDGGFLAVARSMQQQAESRGVKFIFGSPVTQIIPKNGRLQVNTGTFRVSFDQVICTLPSAIFSRLVPDLTAEYITKLNSVPHLGAVNLILALNKSFLPKNIYWLNINTLGMPFLSVVEHTNLISADHYGGDRLLYVGNYLPADHPYFQCSSDQLLNQFSSALKRINPHFETNWVRKSWIWTDPFAQPVITRNYSKIMANMVTPVPNLYLANMHQVYPWDRGTNYAVELGQRVAGLCIKE